MEKEDFLKLKYFSFPVSIMPQLAKLSNDKLADLMNHVFFYCLNGYEKEPYPEDSRLAVYFETLKSEIDNSVWLVKRKSLGGANAQKKIRNKA